MTDMYIDLSSAFNTIVPSKLTLNLRQPCTECQQDQGAHRGLQQPPSPTPPSAERAGPVGSRTSRTSRLNNYFETQAVQLLKLVIALFELMDYEWTLQYNRLIGARLTITRPMHAGTLTVPVTYYTLSIHGGGAAAIYYSYASIILLHYTWTLTTSLHHLPDYSYSGHFVSVLLRYYCTV